MIRPMLASLSAAALALTLVSAPAEARPRRGGAVAAGAVIGLAAGAIIGSAIANRHRDRVVTYHPDYAPAYAGHGYVVRSHPYAQPYGYGVARPAYGYPPGYTVYEPDEVY